MEADDRTFEALQHDIDTVAVMVKRSMQGSTTRWTHRAIGKVVYARFRHDYSWAVVGLAISKLEDEGWLTNSFQAKDLKTEVNYG